MIEMFIHPNALPFAVALTLMALLTALEILSLLMGSALSDLVDSFMPDLDIDVDADLDLDADVDADLDVSSGGHGLVGLLSWLNIDKVPFLMVLVSFLASFGLIGIGLQTIVAAVSGTPLKATIATIATLPLTLPVMKVITGTIAKLLPQDETEVVSRESLVGAHAVITLGTAAAGSPAEAKLRDRYGTTHYVMVEPKIAGAELRQGQQVLLVARKNQITFLAQATELPSTEALTGDTGKTID